MPSRPAAARIAPPATLQTLLHHADTLLDGAQTEGRLGYQRAADAILSFPAAFRIAYYLYRHFGIRRLLADRLADRVELVLVTRLLIDRLLGFNSERLHPIFGERITARTDEIIEHLRGELGGAFDALQRLYPDYVAALEVSHSIAVPRHRSHQPSARSLPAPRRIPCVHSRYWPPSSEDRLPAIATGRARSKCRNRRGRFAMAGSQRPDAQCKAT